MKRFDFYETGKGYAELRETEAGPFIYFDDHIAPLEAVKATVKPLDDGAIEAACLAHAPQFDRMDRTIQKYAREQMRSAIGAYLAIAPSPALEANQQALEYAQHDAVAAETELRIVRKAKNPRNMIIPDSVQSVGDEFTREGVTYRVVGGISSDGEVALCLALNRPLEANQQVIETLRAALEKIAACDHTDEYGYQQPVHSGYEAMAIARVAITPTQPEPTRGQSDDA